jgi:hypothetical protein
MNPYLTTGIERPSLYHSCAIASLGYHRGSLGQYVRESGIGGQHGSL